MDMGAPKGDGTVGKALATLDLVADFGRPVRFAEVQARSLLPKATLYRLVQTLTNQGMLRFDAATGRYAPGLRLVRLAHAAWRQSALAPIARPFLDDLSAQVGQTIHLAQLDRGQVLYVDKCHASEPVQMFSSAGKVGPGYCTGVGKAMLAHLPPDERAAALKLQSFHRHTDNTLTQADALEADLARVRETGIAYDREEHEPGIICIAAPILSASGRVMGALSITAATDRMTLDDLAAFRGPLLDTAARIADEAGSWQFPDQKDQKGESR